MLLLGTSVVLPILILIGSTARDLGNQIVVADGERQGLASIAALDTLFRDASSYAARTCVPGSSVGPAAVGSDVSAMNRLETSHPLGSDDWKAAATSWEARTTPQATSDFVDSLAALFPLGGRVADIVGHRTTLLVGVFTFALFSALCGATPTGSGGEEWIIVCRVLQGASAAFLFPAALAIVVATFDVSERGKYLAIFFSISVPICASILVADFVFLAEFDDAAGRLATLRTRAPFHLRATTTRMGGE